MARVRERRNTLINITVSNEIIIRGDKESRDTIINHLENALRFKVKDDVFVKGKRLTKRDNFIYGYLYNNDVIRIPRGYWPRLFILMKDNNIKYKIVDKRVERLYKRKRRVPEVILRDYQISAVDRAIEIGEGIIQAPCGSGKTQILTEIIRQTNQWTLVLVHTDDLITQMTERLQEAFGQPIGIIKQNERRLRPITVGSVMTLRRRNLTKNFLSKWGCIMLDESHHMPAESFSEVLRKFPAFYRFGTTATTTREDGLHGLMYATIGYRIFNVTYDELYKGGYLMPAHIVPIETAYYNPANPTTQYQKIVRDLAWDQDRNELIVDNLISHASRYNLVLSSRIDHLRNIQEKMLSINPGLSDRTQLLIGAMSGKDREATLNKMRRGELNYIFATQLADEGLDLPILDRLHLVYPTKSERKIQQEVGRIQRTYPSKDKAIVYDYKDTLQPTFLRHWNRRVRVYKRIGCSINA